MVTRLVKTIWNDFWDLWAHLRHHGVKSTINLLNSKDAPATAQFFKYGICGGGATIVHQGIVFLLAATFIPALTNSMIDGVLITDEIRERNLIINNLIAFPFSNITAYYLNAMWVFTSGRHSRFKEFMLFTLVSVISMICGLVAGPMMVGKFGVSTLFAQGSNLVTSVLVNFVCRKFLIFQR